VDHFSTPTTDTATALQAMRDTLGVDAITGLNLGDAVKVGMTLGRIISAEGDWRDQDLTDAEHDALRLAVQDILQRRQGVDPDAERTRLVFAFGSMAAIHLATEFGLEPYRMTRAQAEQLFTNAERDRLMDALTLVLNARTQATDRWQPPVAPFDDEGRCDDQTCLSCRPGQVTQ